MNTSGTPPIQVIGEQKQYPSSNGVLDFLRRQRIFIFAGLVLLTVGLVVLTARPDGSLKTQLNSSLVIPGEDLASLPSFSDQGNANQGAILFSPPANTNSLQVLSGTGSTNTNIADLKPAASSNQNSGYQLQHEKFLNALQPANVNAPYLKAAAPLEGDTAQTGPEVELFLGLSIALAFAAYRLRKMWAKRHTV